METKRLKLRILKEKDAQFLFKLMNTEKWHLYIGDRNISDENSARNYINSRMSSRLSDKGFINHLMLDKKKKTAVGTCSIHDRLGIEGLDIGYALLPEYEGMGYATEGASLMAELAFKKYKQEKISAITTDQNTGSCKVLEKLGFRHQSYIRLPDGNVELRLYVLEKENFDQKIIRLFDKTCKQERPA